MADRAKFITIEGIEGVGKTTVIEAIKAYFDEHHIAYVATREPGGTPIAETIRSLVLSHRDEKLTDDTELLLLYASRAQHIAEVIKPALAEGKCVLSDRFHDATFAYQGGGRGIELNRIELLDKWVLGDLAPDVTIVLNAPWPILKKRILNRGQMDRIESEDESFFVRAQETYLKRAKANPNRYQLVDASTSLEEVEQAVLKVIAHVIEGG